MPRGNWISLAAESGSENTAAKVVDGRAFTERLAEHEGVPFAGSYEIHSIRVVGAFHPKVCMLSAGQRVLVGVGSSNLTRGGLGANLEIVSFYRGNVDDPLPQAVRSFLADLVLSKSIQMSARARSVMRVVAKGERENATFLTSMRRPLLPQLKERLRGFAVADLHCVSPLYAGVREEEDGLDLRLISKLRALWPTARDSVRVYTHFPKGTAGKLAGAETFDYAPTPETDDSTDDAEEAVSRAQKPGNLHAKALLFVNSTGVGRLYVGSANLTEPALSRTPASGNVEVLLEHSLDRKQTDSLIGSLTPTMFRPVNGKPKEVPKQRRPPPVGAGHISDAWERAGKIVLEVLRPVPARLRVGRKSSEKYVVPTHGKTEVTVPRDVAEALGIALPLERPFLLWETVGRTQVPFLVNPSVVAPVLGASGALGELAALLGELEGRTPAKASPTPPSGEADENSDREDDEEDPLAHLTRTDFQAELDVIAALVVRLRRGLPEGASLEELWPALATRWDWYPTIRRFLGGRR
ncbi:MAG: hypothetical protein HYZ28_05735 [Myxococcales bacterium]|nr:hypothetical protein [Myxococcales bacterium]